MLSTLWRSLSQGIHNTNVTLLRLCVDPETCMINKSLAVISYRLLHLLWLVLTGYFSILIPHQQSLQECWILVWPSFCSGSTYELDLGLSKFYQKISGYLQYEFWHVNLKIKIRKFIFFFWNLFCFYIWESILTMS